MRFSDFSDFNLVKKPFLGTRSSDSTIMPPFSARRLNPNPIFKNLRQRPFILFGLPFISLMVISSFALQNFTKTRYDYHAQKTSTMSAEEGMRMDKGRKRVDIREEYYVGITELHTSCYTALAQADNQRINGITSSTPSSPPSSLLDADINPDTSPSPSKPRKSKLSLAAIDQDAYEPVRVPRPAGMPEWGPGVREEEAAPLKGSRKEDRWV